MSRTREGPRATALAAVLSLVALAPPAASVEQIDWCAPVVVRPDRRYYSGPPTCEPWWPDDEIARRADLILDGFTRPSNSTVTPDNDVCFGAQTMEKSKLYHDRLRAAAATYGRTLTFAYQARLDLIDRHTAGTPGFDPHYLLDARKGWREVTDFFWRDTSPACACGCEWSDVAGPSLLGKPPGERLRDLIDAVGGSDTYKTKICYASPLGTGGTLAGAPRLFFGTAALADQTNAAYRAWRIGHMLDAMTVGGFDVIELNNKFTQYVPSSPPPWWGGSAAPNVSAYMAADTTQWSAEPLAYAYREYLAGWAAFADDLAAAGIPYEVNVSPFAWRAGSIYDDPATPGVDEGEVIRDVARRARYVLLARYAQFSAAEFDAVIADIQSQGAVVVPYDGNCGLGAPAGRPSPPLTAGLTVTPDAAPTPTFTGTAIRVSVSGTATGAWDADFYCDCASAPCGSPDASATGLTGTQWQLPASLCDANYRASTGTRRPRAEVRRAGYSAVASSSITVCAPACSNGRDDDRDGLVDYPADPGCSSPADTDETSPTLACDDNVDDDGDGKVDYPADHQCTSSAAGDEGQRSSACGIGAELLLAIPLLARARRRRLAAI